jgi:cell pole-organizing protein PopZ
VTDAAPPTEPVTPEPIEPVSRDEPAAPTPRAGSAEATLPLAAAAAVGDVRTLEDTVAELLRPMLRQWLDDNMPRIVEKALRVEIAGRPAAPSKPKG